MFKSGVWTNETSATGASGHLRLPVASDDPAVNGVLLFGGDTANVSHSATLEFYAGSWHNITATLTVPTPGGLFGTAGYLASERAVVAMLGILFNRSGVTDLAYATWAFVGGNWVNESALVGTPPPGLYRSGRCGGPELPGDPRVRRGGGRRTNLSPYTFVLSSAPVVSATVSKSTIDAGTSVTFTSAVTGGLLPRQGLVEFRVTANSSGSTANSTPTGVPVSSSPP